MDTADDDPEVIFVPGSDSGSEVELQSMLPCGLSARINEQYPTRICVDENSKRVTAALRLSVTALEELADASLLTSGPYAVLMQATQQVYRTLKAAGNTLKAQVKDAAQNFSDLMLELHSHEHKQARRADARAELAESNLSLLRIALTASQVQVTTLTSDLEALRAATTFGAAHQRNEPSAAGETRAGLPKRRRSAAAARGWLETTTTTD